MRRTVFKKSPRFRLRFFVVVVVLFCFALGFFEAIFWEVNLCVLFETVFDEAYEMT